MGITVLLLKLKTKLEFPKNVRLFSIWIKYWNLFLYNFLSSPTQQGLDWERGGQKCVPISK